MRVFYGWWIVLAAFLNLFFSVGIVYYGFPVFYPSMVDSLGFTRAQLPRGFLWASWWRRCYSESWQAS